MPEDNYPLVDLRTAAMDLARCLSSLKHFLPAARQLSSCEHLPLHDVDRHSRKIVTLIEIARSTLLRYRVRLYLFASCNPALAHHKEAYFNLLRMLRRLRPHMKDPGLNERISRLLLSLSTSMHIATVADAGYQPAASCSAEACRESLLSPRSPSPPPIAVNHPTACHRAPQHGAMLPPDVLLAQPAAECRLWREHTPQPEASSPPRGRRAHRPARPAQEESEPYCGGVSERTGYVPKPARRFGILFTMRRPYQRHHR